MFYVAGFASALLSFGAPGRRTTQKLRITQMLQAAEYHNFGYFTLALAVNLLDRFMAAQPTSVRPLG